MVSIEILISPGRVYLFRVYICLYYLDRYVNLRLQEKALRRMIGTISMVGTIYSLFQIYIMSHAGCLRVFSCQFSFYFLFH